MPCRLQINPLSVSEAVFNVLSLEIVLVVSENVGCVCVGEEDVRELGCGFYFFCCEGNDVLFLCFVCLGVGVRTRLCVHA